MSDLTVEQRKILALQEQVDRAARAIEGLNVELSKRASIETVQALLSQRNEAVSKREERDHDLANVRGRLAAAEKTIAAQTAQIDLLLRASAPAIAPPVALSDLAPSRARSRSPLRRCARSSG